MFGYVIARKDTLSEDQLARYQGCYCGLCNALKAHFGALHRLQAGDMVGFTDLDGTTYRYRVTAVEVLGAAAVGEMTQSGADLTLFTCTVGGKNRIAVRCESVA
jgi:sortase (surface protein transpeptidase)